MDESEKYVLKQEMDHLIKKAFAFEQPGPSPWMGATCNKMSHKKISVVLEGEPDENGHFASLNEFVDL